MITNTIIHILTLGTLVSGMAIDTGTPYVPRRAAIYQCTVKAVHEVCWSHKSGTSRGICLQVASKEKEYFIIISPQWHLGTYMSFSRGDRLTVKASVSLKKGKRIMVPQWIKKNDRTLHLRNASGVPYWEMNSGTLPGRGRGKGRQGRGRKMRGGHGMAPGR